MNLNKMQKLSDYLKSCECVTVHEGELGEGYVLLVGHHYVFISFAHYEALV